MKKKKNNSKRKAITLLSVIWAIVLFLCVFAVLPVSYGKDGIKEYNPPISKINLGLDIQGGTYNIYEANRTVKNEDTEETEPVADFDSKLSETIKIMQKRLRTYNIAEATVTKAGAYSVRVEIPEVENKDTILASITKGCKLEICYPNDTDSSKKGDIIATNDDIKNVISTTKNGGPAVSIQLKGDAKSAYSDATQWASKYDDLYVWLDDAEYTKITPTERVTNGKVVITGLYETDDAASEFAMQLNRGALQVTFKAPVSYTISPALGENTVKIALIAGSIAIVLVLAAMFILFRNFGLAAALSLFIFSFLFIVVLSTLPWITLTLPGIIGIIVAFALLIEANVIIFERIKNEYKSGKSIIAACDSGYQKSLWTILDSHAIALIVSIAFWFVGSTFVRSFAVTLFAGVLLSALCSLVFTRFSIKQLLRINSTSPKKYNLSREVSEDYE